MTEQCLGIDWGEKRIGMALGNAETGIASPLGSVGSLEALLEVAKNEKIERLVVGVPLDAERPGKKLNEAFTAFLEALGAHSGLPISRVDERFSSQAADRLGGRKNKDGERDALAAMVILQSYFDSL